MHCPRCGTPNEPGDRFCSSCGTALAKAAAERTERRSPRDRLRRVLGTTRGARLLSAATAIALVGAVVGFVALSTEDDEIPRDAYTIATDRMCIAAKRQIVAAERLALARQGPPRTSGLAQSLLPIVAAWRSDFRALKVPADRLEEARRLDRSLRDVEIGIGALARSADRGDRGLTLTRAEQADEAAARVEEEIASLGLSRCARLAIGFTPD